jgi:hypothetical protein
MSSQAAVANPAYGPRLLTRAEAAEENDPVVEKFLTQLLKKLEAQTESALTGLKQSFDLRLSVLQGRSAAARLRSTIRGRAKLGGKVKAGSGY